MKNASFKDRVPKTGTGLFEIPGYGNPPFVFITYHSFRGFSRHPFRRAFKLAQANQRRKQ